MNWDVGTMASVELDSGIPEIEVNTDKEGASILSDWSQDSGGPWHIPPVADSGFPRRGGRTSLGNWAEHPLESANALTLVMLEMSQKMTVYPFDYSFHNRSMWTDLCAVNYTLREPGWIFKGGMTYSFLPVFSFTDRPKCLPIDQRWSLAGNTKEENINELVGMCLNNFLAWMAAKIIIEFIQKDYKSVADPNFPRGEGANPPGGGAPTYDCAKISQKLHGIERIWIWGRL